MQFIWQKNIDQFMLKLIKIICRGELKGLFLILRNVFPQQKKNTCCLVFDALRYVSFSAQTTQLI